MIFPIISYEFTTISLIMDYNHIHVNSIPLVTKYTTNWNVLILITFATIH
jgi:hypothetical protein